MSFALLPASSVAGASAIAAAPEPRNISLLKQEIRTYVESGEYLRGIAEVAAEADAWIEERARAGQKKRAGGEAGNERLAVIIDLDETLLYNADHMLAQDFGYVRSVWDEWVFKAAAPAIEPVRKLYQTARELDVAVVFVTGRRERYREPTERNLRAIGCGDYERLICKPDDGRGTSAAFKLGARQSLAAEGFVIIANVGDQHSDLAGGGAERSFKLPNPFYLSQ